MTAVATYGLCECGCGQPTSIAKKTNRANGHVKGRPVRFVFGHGNARGRLENFRVVSTGHETPCHIWTGSTNRKGYGRTNVGGKSIPAHRATWEAAHGPVPDGLELDHLCRQRACVRVDHLEAVTHAENVRRAAGAR